MSLDPGNVFETLPQNLDAETVESIIQQDNIRIERIVSKGHSTPKSEWYDQPQSEWVIVLRGEAIVSFADGTEHHLSAGAYLNLPAHTKHRVSWTLPDAETIWLAIHY